MPDTLDVLHKADLVAAALDAAARAYRDAALAVERLADGDARKVREVAVLAGAVLATRRGKLADAERRRREARKALHKAAEAAAVVGALSHVPAGVPARTRGGAHAPSRTSPARDAPAPAGAPARVRARTRGRATSTTSTATRARAPAVAPPEGTAAAALLAWRLGLGLGRKAAGERLGVSGTYVGALEIGRARPSAAVAARVDAVAGVPVATWGELARPAKGGRGRPGGGR